MDLTPGHTDLFGDARWELRSPWREDGTVLNTGAAPRKIIPSQLSDILEKSPDKKYYLSKAACLGILRRAGERGKELPAQLESALMVQAGLIQAPAGALGLKAYHINQRDEGIDLGSVSGALMAAANTQMQPFVTGEPIAFATNQRAEVRDLHDVAGALVAQPGMKQQTFIAENCLTSWDTQQKRIFTEDGVSPTLAGADRGGGRNPGGLLFTAAFSAGAGAAAGSIAFSEAVAPTLKGSPSGNCMPSVLCLNDQGGAVMEVSEGKSGTLRAQEHGHPPLIYENHGIDARYTGPHEISPTLSARAGTGGNNLPLIAEGDSPVLCMTGNAIDRQPQNGGNSLGVQENLSYTITTSDRHTVFSRQRVDVFQEREVVSTESARQHKDATDLVYQEMPEFPMLIRRLTPLECERLQGFPTGWTDIPGASDSARYRALGNSVAIPCVEFIMGRIVRAAGMEA